jgi:hypothetical protein
MKKTTVIVAVILLLLGAVLTTDAANIHIRYFESADVILGDSRFQIFSFSALEDEQVTIVAYGLEEGIVPGITVLDPTGTTMVEDLNSEGTPVAVAELIAPENGTYTFLVSRQSDVSGLMRVMLFEGEALGQDLTLLDTIDPFLPSRAYLVAGDEEDPIEMTIRVLLDADDESAENPPTIFASRGTEVEVAPFEERINPVQQYSWLNSQGDIFYTLNVRPLPEPVPTTSKAITLFSPRSDVTDLEDIEITLGDGGEPEMLQRAVCLATALAGAEVLAGPGDDYAVLETLGGGEQYEIVGENGMYVQVVDVNNPSGASWILKSNLIMPDLASEDCLRVGFVEAPPLTEENSAPGDPPGFGGVPPGGNNPPDEPTTTEGTDDSDTTTGVTRPEPPPPDSGPPFGGPGGEPPCVPPPNFSTCDEYYEEYSPG